MVGSIHSVHLFKKKLSQALCLDPLSSVSVSSQTSTKDLPPRLMDASEEDVEKKEEVAVDSSVVGWKSYLGNSIQRLTMVCSFVCVSSFLFSSFSLSLRTCFLFRSKS